MKNCLLKANRYGSLYNNIDYTLVIYENCVLELIYRLAIQELLTRYHYPAAIRDLPFDPSFAIRGLHFDISRGFLFKLDAYHNIMLGTVYRGHHPVPDEEVFQAYQGVHSKPIEKHDPNF